jgi:hypothetical protein
LVGNTAFRRYLKTISGENPDKVEEEKKFDGVRAVPTPISTRSKPCSATSNCGLCHKQLWTVEQTFRTAKHLLATRPIFLKLDETIRETCSATFSRWCSRRRWKIALWRSLAPVPGRRSSPISTR